MRTIISHANDERTPGRERVNNYNFFNMLSMSKSLFGSLLKLFAITSSLTGGKYARRKKSACFLFVTRAFVLIGISTTTKVSLVFFLPPGSLFWNWPKKRVYWISVPGFRIRKWPQLLFFVFYSFWGSRTYIHKSLDMLHSAENDRTQSDNNHSLKCLQTGLARVCWASRNCHAGINFISLNFWRKNMIKMHSARSLVWFVKRPAERKLFMIIHNC